MESGKFDLFYTLLKLRSYLVSMLDDPDDCYDNFYLTEEYLERRYPNRKNDIMELLKSHGIGNDCDIAFDENIHLKFKDIMEKSSDNTNLVSLLNGLEIDTKEMTTQVKHQETYRAVREESLTQIMDTLLRLAKNWAIHKELENRVDDFSALSEEEVLRPDEEKSYDELGNNTVFSFDIISKLTLEYIHLLADYYFKYSGDIILAGFVEDLNEIKKSVAQKYYNLFKEHGLDSDWIDSSEPD